MACTVTAAAGAGAAGKRVSGVATRVPRLLQRKQGAPVLHTPVPSPSTSTAVAGELQTEGGSGEAHCQAQQQQQQQCQESGTQGAAASPSGKAHHIFYFPIVGVTHQLDLDLQGLAFGAL
jgi:hypothetical protein